jgi:dTDP-glucose 4,6-dehydratase
MKKYLVTGGLGFIGSNFINTLFENLIQAEEGFEIHCIDKETYAGTLRNLSKTVSSSKSFIHHKNDICDSQVLELMKNHRFEYCAHFAAESHVDRSISDPQLFLKTNVIGTANLLNGWRENQTGRFLHVSTDEVYGSLKVGEASEESALEPSSPYSASKAASDLLVLSYVHTYGIDAVVSRCTNNFGLNQNDEKLIPKLVKNILNDEILTIYAEGTNIREWIHVSDHVRALLNLLNAKVLNYKVYNIGSRNRMTNMQVLDSIKVTSGVLNPQIEHTEDRPGHDFRYAVNSERIEKELAWFANYSFEEGLREIIGSYRKFKSFEQSAREV